MLYCTGISVSSPCIPEYIVLSNDTQVQGSFCIRISVLVSFKKRRFHLFWLIRRLFRLKVSTTILGIIGGHWAQCIAQSPSTPTRYGEEVKSGKVINITCVCLPWEHRGTRQTSIWKHKYTKGIHVQLCRQCVVTLMTYKYFVYALEWLVGYME